MVPAPLWELSLSSGSQIYTRPGGWLPWSHVLASASKPCHSRRQEILQIILHGGVMISEGLSECSPEDVHLLKEGHRWAIVSRTVQLTTGEFAPRGIFSAAYACKASAWSHLPFAYSVFGRRPNVLYHPSYRAGAFLLPMGISRIHAVIASQSERACNGRWCNFAFNPCGVPAIEGSDVRERLHCFRRSMME